MDIIMSNNIRSDLQLIADTILPDSRVLDVGCGDGSLMSFLIKEKNIEKKQTYILDFLATRYYVI